MKKSQSLPQKLDECEIPQLRKSKSSDDFSENDFYFEEFFEGDGPLGINFYQDKDKNIIIKKIVSNTVADETFGLQENMILLLINNKSISNKSFEKVMEKIENIWRNKSLIHLSFKKKINNELYSTLGSIDYLMYYDDFIELGFSQLSDYDFIEYNDLIKMGIPVTQIQNFQKLNKKINPEIYNFCKEMNCKQYFEKIIDIGIERIIDVELLEYNDLIDIEMSNDIIIKFSQRFRNIIIPLDI
tara:strand:- start:3220 stop:3948 length:729 start_codon:yes stop_codon:yes gene_type:complete